MKNVLIVIVCVFVVYLAFKRTDAVQSIEFQGESYELSHSYQRSGSDVYMYTLGGENFQRSRKYIQVAHLPSVDMPAEEYRRQYMETFKQASGFVEISEYSFFYTEANTSVHSALIHEDDSFKLYGYAEMWPEGTSQLPSSHRATPATGRDFEETIGNLPQPPRTFSTWF